MTATSRSTENLAHEATSNPPSELRRSCLVCRVIGLFLVIASALGLMLSSAESMEIGVFAAFALYWVVGAGATLFILSVSALRQANSSST